MNDLEQKLVSTLAIAEKRSQRPGGCVGIFFQLFDWNKRLAKKKFFSKKLLPSSRLKRAAKKFSGGDKLPGAKLRLIADENRGGFPKKADAESLKTSSANIKHCKMQSPNLVARLMGLESMPVAHRDQSSKKVLASEKCHDQSKISCQNIDFCYDGNQSSEKGHQKFELRPQKLQKTGFFERAPVSKLGTEAYQFKSVLLRSRKQHRKLASPVKSPRLFSGRNAARLMEAATKILEPSLEATNRAKRVLSYSTVPSSRIYDQDNGATTPSIMPWTEGNRCNSCGHLVGVNFSSKTEEQVPEISSSSSDLTSSSGRSRLNSKFSPHDKERRRENGKPLFSEDQAGTSTLTVQAEQNVKSRRNIMDREVYLHKDLGNSKRVQSDVASCKPKHNNQKQNAVWASKDLRSPRNYIHPVLRRDSYPNHPSGTKDYIALNRNLASQSRARMHVKVVENRKFDESATMNRMTESSARVNSLYRKRRSFSSTQFHGTQPAESTLIRGRNGCNDNRQIGMNVQCAQSSVKNEIQKKAESGTGGGNYSTDTVPFMFNSSLRFNNRSGFSKETFEKTQNIPHNKKASADVKKRHSSIQRAKEHTVDALGSLLEQKLRELTHLEIDESEKGVGLVGGRSTAAILEELISALTTQNSTKENADDLESSQYYDSPDKSSCQLKSNLMSCSMMHSQGCSEGRPSVRLPLAVDCDNPSPTSIFEACFSNDSNCSHSPDSGSGNNSHLQFADSSHFGKQKSCLETDISDSGSIMHMAIHGIKRPVFWNDGVASINYFNKGDIKLSESNLSYSSEHIWHADVLFGAENLLVDPVFVSKMQALSEVLEASYACGTLGFTDAMTSSHQCKKFLVHCMMEYMVAGSGSYHQPKPTCWAWAKLPFLLTTEDLMKEVYGEILKWKDLAGKVPDEIVEWELRRSTGVWKSFELETFKIGAEIEEVLFQILIDEMVVDHW